MNAVVLAMDSRHTAKLKSEFPEAETGSERVQCILSCFQCILGEQLIVDCVKC